MPNAGSMNNSENNAIVCILADIPFFCVGLMTFGVCTFLLFLRRINFVALYLYISLFLAFGAAIFDLGHILGEVRPSVLITIHNDNKTISGLVITREVGFALSLGFLFIFLWHLVAQCPHNEKHSSSTVSLDRPPVHSASWKRWGVVGFILQWALLVSSLAIPVLQVVWRISPPPIRFGTLYIAEATIEIVVSALFILKILLNLYISQLTPWWRPLRANLAPLVALGISTGLGLGNLLTLAFSETILGRFLRAIELYILIIFTLITSFYRTTHNDTDKSFIRISEKSGGSLPRFNPPIRGSAVVPQRGSGLVSIIREVIRPSVSTQVVLQDAEQGTRESTYSQGLRWGRAGDEKELDVRK